MNNRIFVSIILISFSLLLTSCWSRKELNDMAIASAIGIDKSGKQYRVSVQIVVPSEVAAKQGGGYETPITLYTTTAKTIFEAVRKMTTLAPRKVYLAQLRVVVFGEAIAREGIGPALDYLARDHEIREEDLYTLIAKGNTAEDTLKVLTRLTKIPAVKMFGSLKTLNRYWAPTSVVQLSDVMFDLITENKHLAIAGIQIVGVKEQGDTKKNVEAVDPATYLQFADTAVFHDDKLIGWLNESESKGYNYITDHVNKTAGHGTCPNGGGTFAIDVIRTKTKVTGSIEDGKPRIDVAVHAEGNIADIECDIDLTQPKSIEQLQKEAGDKVSEVIKKALNKIQHEYKSDVFGFGEVLHRDTPRAWKKIKKNWNDIFPTVSVNVNSDFKIRNIGTMGNSVYQPSEE
ncbi:Ger(x)C family spore germination protein [Cohnella sp. WQ 127256]|uniref:Ger(x)C family spore germination protein n=1 Tax=Cohnella sp. WQ 127256 TaxID=2938790 RepID=UPI002119400E|nr:Ger(x)C family spore germination protein [Cohnella sp. WQ 127256]